MDCQCMAIGSTDGGPMDYWQYLRYLEALTNLPAIVEGINGAARQFGVEEEEGSKSLWMVRSSDAK